MVKKTTDEQVIKAVAEEVNLPINQVRYIVETYKRIYRKTRAEEIKKLMRGLEEEVSS